MALWTIKSVGDSPRTWKNRQNQDMVSYKIAVEAKDGQPHPPKNQKAYSNVELVQKPTSPAPTAGAELDGDIEERTFKKKDDTEGKSLKFKKAQRGGGGGGGRSWKPRPDDSPMVFASRQASIGTQHSQDMAIRVLELAAGGTMTVEAIMQELGVETTIEVEGQEHQLGLVAAFQRQVNQAGAKAWEREEENGVIAAALAQIGG